MEVPVKAHTGSPAPAIPPTRARRSTTFTVKGLLVTVDEEDGDAYTGLALITDDDDEYRLVGESRIAALTRHVDESVIVWGSLERGPRSEKLIRVKNFQVVHWNED